MNKAIDLFDKILLFYLLCSLLFYLLLCLLLQCDVDKFIYGLCVIYQKRNLLFSFFHSEFLLFFLIRNCCCCCCFIFYRFTFFSVSYKLFFLSSYHCVTSSIVHFMKFYGTFCLPKDIFIR